MSKSEVEWCKKIEIWWLLRDMGLGKKTYKSTTVSWGDNGSRGSVGAVVSILVQKYVRFHYTQTDNTTGEKKDFNYRVQLIETPCHFGGTRFWFECPLGKGGKVCGRRVGVLYKDGDYFGCRHCYNLTYSSRNVTKNYRYYPLFKVIELEQKIEDLHKKTVKFTHAGKPTKKRMKIAKLYDESFRAFSQCKL